ncbi:MAG: type II RES/Xre toxin-antitoxin system antitoxin [Candidatus Rokuibacteriota bacterium]
MTVTAQLVEVLGGRAVFREREATYQTVIDKARSGLPYAALEAITERFDIPHEDLVRVLHLPPRTLARRKKARKLSGAESDRLLRLARIAARAEEVFGKRQKAAAWLQKPNRALGGATPLDLLDTDLGALEVERILGRIEHGVYS